MKNLFNTSLIVLIAGILFSCTEDPVDPDERPYEKTELSGYFEVESYEFYLCGTACVLQDSTMLIETFHFSEDEMLIILPVPLLPYEGKRTETGTNEFEFDNDSYPGLFTFKDLGHKKIELQHQHQTQKEVWILKKN